MTIHNVPLYFAEDWQSGRIGGGLWSTGLALARYFGTEGAVDNLKRLCSENNGVISVLELGSGNGFLAVCLAAVAAAHPNDIKMDLVVTDTADHLRQIEETLALNKDTTRHIEHICVKEHMWGCFPEEVDERNVGCRTTTKYDLIVGSDVAYREDLYDPLIKSLKHYSHAKTVSLIGVTMADTTPAFFERLQEENFFFRKFADHLLDDEFRGGTTFAIFAMKLRDIENKI